MRTRISLMLPLICAPLAFGGCGEDSSSTEANGGSVEVGADSDIVVGTFDDLPVCSDKREMATAYVKDEKTAYFCEDGKWVEDDDSDAKSSSSGKAESSSSVIPSSSSDVIPSSSSSVIPSGVEGSSSSSEAITSSSSSADSSANEQPEIIKVKDKSVAGVSQKGPFIKGSSVNLYELDGETCAQTGKSFTGMISNDKGEFSISSVTLASQYALLVAKGYYRNEVSGKTSSGTITLNALTDLSDREKVNVNLLTHLEYERALYLVGTGINVPAAKKQAEAEIFNAFGIQGDFANSEDLNIFSSGEGDAALLAFSVLMQGDRSEAELTELLMTFATDIEKDGEWNDEETKAKIADWAMNQDLAGGLEFIRSNINGWNLGTAPDFEKYVRNFWYTNYGLGACEGDSKGTVKAVANERSKNYGDFYRCTTNGWERSNDWSWDVPKEDRLNPEIEYGSMTDSRDGHTYKTVVIGAQTWMAENLNYADSIKTPSLKGKSWCYDNDPEKCAVTGRLYTWAAAIDSVALAEEGYTCGYGKECDRLTSTALAANPIQGVCPSGWHLPSYAEWDALLTTAGGSSTAGNALKSASGWHKNGNGTDAYGFSALPAGRRISNGYFDSAGYDASFWSASQYEYDGDFAYNMYLDCNYEAAYLYYSYKGYGYSVRCIKN